LVGGEPDGSAWIRLEGDRHDAVEAPGHGPLVVQGFLENERASAVRRLAARHQFHVQFQPCFAVGMTDVASVFIAGEIRAFRNHDAPGFRGERRQDLLRRGGGKAEGQYGGQAGRDARVRTQPARHPAVLRPGSW
jgi:hypothetical protein